MELIKITLVLLVIIGAPALTPEEEEAGLRTVWMIIALGAAAALPALSLLLNLTSELISKRRTPSFKSLRVSNITHLGLSAAIIIIALKFSDLSASSIGHVVGVLGGALVLYFALSAIQFLFLKIIQMIRRILAANSRNPRN